MSRAGMTTRALERVHADDGWVVWVDRTPETDPYAKDLLGHPGLWRTERRPDAVVRTFSCPPLPPLSGSENAAGAGIEAAVREWACATAHRELPAAWTAPECNEAATWLDTDRLNVRAGTHVAKGGLDCEPERLRLRFPDLVRLDPRLSQMRREWVRALCFDAQSRWQGVRFGVVGGRVGAEIDLSGAPHAWAESLVRWSLETLVFSVGWALPALAVAADPEISSPVFDLAPSHPCFNPNP